MSVDASGTGRDLPWHCRGGVNPVAVGTALRSQARAAPRSDPSVQCILVIFLENQPDADVTAAPYLEALKGRAVFLSTYFGVRHPSQPNYVAAISGSTFGIPDDFDHTRSETTIVDLLEARHISWKAYMQDLPENKLATKAELYVRKHNPFVSFTTITQRQDRLSRVVPATQFGTDLESGTLPQFCWHTANLRNDGHNSGVTFASEQWLRGFRDPLLDEPTFAAETLVVVTSDERKPDANNQVYAVVIGPGATAGTVQQTRYDHYSILRTVEENWSLGTLGRSDKNATWFSFLWGLPSTETTDGGSQLAN
jgi:hypothetical protein